jgi:hypothetical protein
MGLVEVLARPRRRPRRRTRPHGEQRGLAQQVGYALELA